MSARFYLVAPAALAPADILACAKAACEAGDCASIIVPESVKQEDVAALQDLGLAVFLADVEPRIVSRLKADGLHVSSMEHVIVDLRMSLPRDAMVGVNAGTSRHMAMEAAEQGADYVAFTQKAQKEGEPLIQWWNEIAEIPSVPFDAVLLADLATLLPQRPDFIRPSDEMWQSADAATRIIKELSAKLTA
ncbi:MAG: thiamine phosphate synthase [Alphaproteobacteria bacterium]|nr:thiamine phosphate synthase [Alphaproteobacteria bacterium]